MNRIYNNPDYMVEDMTKGFLKANKDLIAETENPQVVKYKKAPVPNKVGIVTGGGSGHLLVMLERTFVTRQQLVKSSPPLLQKHFWMRSKLPILAKVLLACMVIMLAIT